MRKIIAILISICLSTALNAANNSVQNALIDVKVQAMPDNRVKMDFKFQKPLKKAPASFLMENPSRLVLDFLDANTKLDSRDLKSKVDIGAVISYKILSVGSRLRTIFDINPPVVHKGYLSGNTYSLILSGKHGIRFKRNKEVFVSNRIPQGQAKIQHIGFRGADNQGGKLLIDLSSSTVPVEVSKKGRDIILDFQKTSLIPNIATKYDVRDFHSPSQMIVVRQRGKEVRVTLENRGDYGYFAYQVNRQFIVDVYPLTAEEIKRAQLKKKVFTGKKISLNFQDIQIRAVLQLLADFTGINMVVSDEVSGNITLRLNEVPWDQALDIILSTQGLDKRRRGNVMLIGQKASIEKREKAELESIKQLETLAPLRSELIQINYAKADEIANLISSKDTSLLSDRGKLSVDARTNAIWIQDTLKNIDEIRQLIAKLDVPVKQVLIEARIVTIRTGCSEDLGIRWGVSRPTHLSGTLLAANEMAQGVEPAEVGPLDPRRLNLDLAAVPVNGNPASIGIALARLGNNILLDLELSALESEEKAEIVASPRLMTTNQKMAVIESGQDIPYQQATSSGATAVAFKKAVLSLKVTPQITPDDRLVMELQINQDADSGERVQEVPIILTRSINTNVLVDNGQTIVLGGIYQKDKSNTVRRVPFLGQLPVLGNLFRSKSIRESNQELLIFITPKIITNALAMTGIEGSAAREQHARVELDKFGNPVRPYVK